MKKLMTLVLALALVLSLAACGGTGNNTADNTANNTTNNTADNGGDADTGDTGDASFTPVEESGEPSAETPAAGGNTVTSDYGEFTVVEAGKLHMSTNAAFPPYEMTTDDGGFEGIDVEVAGAIAQKLGLELVVDDMAFNAALTAAQTGQSDMVMAGVTVNEDRLEVMDFSDTYATGVQVVIVKEDSPIQTIDDLASAEMIGCQADTTGYIYCSYPPEEGGYGEDHVTAYDNGALAVMALMNGQVDAVVIDNAPAQEFVKANEGLKILDTEFANEDYAIGFAKDNTALRDAVNDVLKELIDDGTVQSIIDKYIPAE